jgi:hypothetical protein
MLVYCLKTDSHLRFGRWTGTLAALKDRLCPRLSEFELTVFQLHSRSPRVALWTLENINDACALYRVWNNIFRLDAFPVFLQIASAVSEASCTVTRTLTGEERTVFEPVGDASPKVKVIEPRGGYIPLRRVFQMIGKVFGGTAKQQPDKPAKLDKGKGPATHPSPELMSERSDIDYIRLDLDWDVDPLEPRTVEHEHFGDPRDTTAVDDFNAIEVLGDPGPSVRVSRCTVD